MSVVAFIGTAAAFCTTVAFIPQILKLRRQGGKDLSYPMLFLYLTGILLWLAYGLMIQAAAVIWANVLTALLVLVSIVLKASPRAKVAHARRLRIAVDMDEVIADSFSEHLRRYNQSTGAQITPEMVSRSGLGAVIPQDQRKAFNDIPWEEGFFADLGVIEGSHAALEELSRHHEVFITSAAMDVPTSFDAKYKWLEKHFSFIPSARIVFCGDKYIIDADVLIDDRSRHFKRFAGTGILFTAPHNAHEAAPLRANNWDDVLRILEEGRDTLPARQPSSVLSQKFAQ